jgi:O-antigen/teichoic acid export membrane protein
MVVQLLAPIFYQRAGDATDKQRIANVNDLILRLTGLILGVTGIVFFAAFFFHRQIFQIFVAKEYASVSHLLQWMLLAAGLFAAGQNISQIPMSQMKSHIIITPKIVTALLGTSLNLAGAYWYGTRGVVIASLLFSLIYFLWMVILLRFKRETKCL